MALMKIKKPGAAKPKASTTKTTAKSTPAKRGPGRPKGSKNKPKTTANSNGDQPKRRGRGPAVVDPKLLAKWQDKIEAAGERLAESQVEHYNAAQNVHAVCSAARNAGLPIGTVAELAGVSRQYLYKGPTGTPTEDGRKHNGPRTTKSSSNGKPTTAKQTVTKAKTTKPVARKKLTIKR